MRSYVWKTKLPETIYSFYAQNIRVLLKSEFIIMIALLTFGHIVN